MTCGSISKIPLMLNLIILDRISLNVFRAWLLQFRASKSISINHFLFWRWELSCGELISSPFTSCFVVYSHPTSTLTLWNTRQYKIVQSDTSTVESPVSSSVWQEAPQIICGTLTSPSPAGKTRKEDGFHPDEDEDV